MFYLGHNDITKTRPYNFISSKIENFVGKFLLVFLIFAQNIDWVHVRTVMARLTSYSVSKEALPLCPRPYVEQ